MEAVLVVLQASLVLLCAPLLLGISRRVKARLQYRRGPSLWQPYRDLAKWWAKDVVESEASTPLSALAPALTFSAVLVAAMLLPLAAERAPLSGWGDLLVVVGLLAMGRFVLALAALESGSAFGALGSSREVAIAALVEPALVLSLIGAALAAGSTDLGTLSAHAVASGLAWYSPAILLAGASFAIVLVAESGHEPFDNPDTHLELTMTHEAMLLEASGPRLALLTYAAQIKMVVVGGLFITVFLPFGAATELLPLPVLIGSVVALAKLIMVAVVLGLLDALLAKVRILAIPELLTTAAGLALTGLAAALWLQH